MSHAVLRLHVVVAAGILAFVCAADAAGQTIASVRPRRVTASVGAGLIGGYPVGAVDGNLRRSTTGAPAPFTLLEAASEIERARSFEARIAVAISRAFEVEVGAVYATPQLTVNIAHDEEFGADTTATEEIEHYGVDVSGVYVIWRPSGGRLQPYLIAGGGYLRQLHESRLRLETGSSVHAGGGIRFWMQRSPTSRRAIGARAEGRYIRRRGGIDFADSSRAFPALSFLALIGF